MPFVWPDYAIDYGEEDPATGIEVNTVRATLHNDGPGIAIDVQWSMWSPTEDPARWHPSRWQWLPSRTRGLLNRWLRDKRVDAEAQPTASKSIRALRAGMTEASPHTVQFLEGDPAWVVVRYSDSAGERWEYVEPGARHFLAGRPDRVRKYDYW